MNISDKALELIIRDVLNGMEELTLDQGYGHWLDDMAILQGEAAEEGATETAVPPRREAVVLAFPGMKSTT